MDIPWFITYSFCCRSFVFTMSNVEVKVDEKKKVDAKGMGLQNNELISDLTTFTPQSIVPEVEVKVTPKVEMEVVESGKLTNSRVVLFSGYYS